MFFWILFNFIIGSKATLPMGWIVPETEIDSRAQIVCTGDLCEAVVHTIFWVQPKTNPVVPNTLVAGGLYALDGKLIMEPGPPPMFENHFIGVKQPNDSQVFVMNWNSFFKKNISPAPSSICISVWTQTRLSSVLESGALGPLCLNFTLFQLSQNPKKNIEANMGFGNWTVSRINNFDNNTSTFRVMGHVESYVAMPQVIGEIFGVGMLSIDDSDIFSGIGRVVSLNNFIIDSEHHTISKRMHWGFDKIYSEKSLPHNVCLQIYFTDVDKLESTFDHMNRTDITGGWAKDDRTRCWNLTKIIIDN